MRNTATRKSSRQSGYGLIFAAIGMVVLLGAAGFSVDIGYLRYQRRLLQSAADSAALAGAAQLGANGSGAQAVLAAKSDSQLNGFQDGSNNIVVTATRTTVNGNADTMQVEVRNTYPTFFMRIFGGALRNATISATATAQYLGGRGCIYALTGGSGLNVTGRVDVPNCNVISNQSITGGGSITAAAVGAHNRSIGTTPAAITGTLQASDPLSYLNAPAAGPCQGDINYGNDHPGTQVLTPGTYSEIVLQPRVPGNRLNPRGTPANNSNITFTPGTYVINGCAGGGASNGLILEGRGTLTTTGATFYIARGGVTIANTQIIHFKASTAAPYAGVLMFQPASNTAAATITGAGAGSYMQGALYFPNATLTLNGSANNPAIDYMVLVAKSLNIATTVNFASDYSSLPNGYSPVRTASLIQ